MKALKIFFLVFLLSSSYVSAQFGFGIGYGVQQMNVSALNEFNRNNELPEMSQAQLLMAPVFFMGTKKFFLEMGYEWVRGQAENNTSSMEITSHFAAMNMAFNLSKNVKHRIFPLVGFGPGVIRMNYTEKASGATTFANMLQSPAQSHNLRTEAAFVRIGAGWHYIFGADTYGKGRTAPSIGIQAGYNLPIMGTDWQTMDGREVKDVPTVNTQGFYAKASLHFF